MLAKLEEEVKQMVEEELEAYENAEAFLSDLSRHGCMSGMIGGLVYFKDTLEFFERNKDSINVLLAEMMEGARQSPADLFGDKWDGDDPLALWTNNQNLLAWFAFEEIAQRLYQGSSSL